MLIAKFGIALLLPAIPLVLASAARAEPTCNIEEAQRLFGQQQRPVQAVQTLPAACGQAGATDYRIYMFEGVMARDAGDRAAAIDWLRQAHAAAPGEPNPALELAFTLEAEHPREAARLYEEILGRQPG